MPEADATAEKILVVGAGSGIGRAVAQDFGGSGARVAVLGRSAAGIEETARSIGSGPGSGRAWVADVTDHDQVSDRIAAAVDWLGGLDVAVNTAGVLGPKGAAGDLRSADWERTVAINLTGTFNALQAEIAAMRQHGGGAIVNVASNLGAHGRVPGLAGYVSSKAAVSALTRVAALDHIAEGDPDQCRQPGPIDTTMSIRPGETVQDRDRRLATTNPSGRVGTLAEIVAAVRYLASAEAGFLVGTDLVIDGGATA